MRAELAGGHGGAERLGELIPAALRGMAAGVAERGGPVPAGGPAAVAAALVAERGERRVLDPPVTLPSGVPRSAPVGHEPAPAANGALPRAGVGAEAALEE